MLITIVVGSALVLVTTIMLMRSVTQIGSTAGDGRWDGALDTAESGLDVALQHLEIEPAWSTGESLPIFASPAEERAWVIAAARARPESEIVQVPGGEAVVVKPVGEAYVYSVGFKPSRDADVVSVRAVRVGYVLEEVEYIVEHALLVGDDMTFTGSALVNDTNDNEGASVHINGTVTVGGSASIEGCLSSSGSTISGDVNCPPSPVPPEPLPDLDPLVMYPYAHYVLCDGSPYGGPAHATAPDPDETPCNGNETAVTMTGWASTLKSGVYVWRTTMAAAAEGVVYIHHGNFVGKLGDSASDPMDMTIVLSAIGDGTCTGLPSGNLELGGNSNFETHPDIEADGYDIAIVAQGDVDMEGNVEVDGVIMLQEQIDDRGNADQWGAVVAVGACHTTGSPVVESTMTGNSSINYPGPIPTPFTHTELSAKITEWYEL